MPLTSADVSNKRFTTSRLRPGYVQEDVDALLRRVETTLAAVENGARSGAFVTASDVMRSQFRTTRMRHGYDEEEVDLFLDEIAEALRARGLYASGVGAGSRGAQSATAAPRMRPEDVRGKGFNTTRLRSGYAEDQVDAFLDRAEATIAALVNGRRENGLLTATEVRGASFATNRLRPGYDEREVDDFLDQLADELERYGLH